MDRTEELLELLDDLEMMGRFDIKDYHKSSVYFDYSKQGWTVDYEIRQYIGYRITVTSYEKLDDIIKRIHRDVMEWMKINWPEDYERISTKAYKNADEAFSLS